MITPELDENMEVLIDDSAPADMRGEVANTQGLCPVCGTALGLPYVWIVFERETTPPDFFVHPNCVARLKAGQFFCQN